MTQKRTGSRKQHNRISVLEELRSRGHGCSARMAPKGGVHLRRVPWEHLGRYLAGRVRDNRSFETRDRKGNIHDPVLTYWTFVNFSRAYQPKTQRERALQRITVTDQP